MGGRFSWTFAHFTLHSIPVYHAQVYQPYTAHVIVLKMLLSSVIRSKPLEKKLHKQVHAEASFLFCRVSLLVEDKVSHFADTNLKKPKKQDSDGGDGQTMGECGPRVITLLRCAVNVKAETGGGSSVCLSKINPFMALLRLPKWHFVCLAVFLFVLRRYLYRKEHH